MRKKGIIYGSQLYSNKVSFSKKDSNYNNISEFIIDSKYIDSINNVFKNEFIKKQLSPEDIDEMKELFYDKLTETPPGMIGTSIGKQNGGNEHDSISFDLKIKNKKVEFTCNQTSRENHPNYPHVLNANVFTSYTYGHNKHYLNSTNYHTVPFQTPTSWSTVLKNINPDVSIRLLITILSSKTLVLRDPITGVYKTHLLQKPLYQMEPDIFSNAKSREWLASIQNSIKYISKKHDLSQEQAFSLLTKSTYFFYSPYYTEAVYEACYNKVAFNQKIIKIYKNPNQLISLF